MPGQSPLSNCSNTSSGLKCAALTVCTRWFLVWYGAVTATWHAMSKLLKMCCAPLPLPDPPLQGGIDAKGGQDAPTVAEQTDNKDLEGSKA